MIYRYKVVLLLAALFASLYCWFFYSAAGVPILAYHRVNEDNEIYSVSPGEFENQMQYLAQHGYTAISLAEMLEAFAGKRAMPVKPVVITFDDGYVDNYQAALPIMEKYGMKATVFIIAGKVGQPGYLTWEDIKAMQARQTEIGSHTLSHVALSEVSREEQVREILDSKQILSQNLNLGPLFLAYPYGKFSQETIAILREAGYQGACTGMTGLNLPGTNRYMLKRINIPRPKFGLMEFRARLLRADIHYKLSMQ